MIRRSEDMRDDVRFAVVLEHHGQKANLPRYTEYCLECHVVHGW